MIYIFKFWDHSFKKYYELDRIVDYSSAPIKFKELIELERNERIGVLNLPKEFKGKLLKMNYPLVFVDGEKEYLDYSYRFLPISIDLFRKDAKDVAQYLLGKLIIHKINNQLIMGKILETEAYYGDNDPASRAYHGKRKYNVGMWKPGGHIFVYMVHANWMFNITTDNDVAQAVLIRSVEPIMGLKFMYENRKRKKLRELCNGPGKWTRAFRITKDLNEKPVGKDLLIAESPWYKFEIKRSHRIGVTRDLEEPLRFFIPSKYTSNNRVF